jgi:hypothetical protein
MPHQSHFMMIDDPDGFREQLKPLLEEIRQNGGS